MSDARVPARVLVAGEGGERPERLMLFVHGVFGRGGNWRSFARRFVAARPRWGAVLVDVRHHGASQGFAPPDTILAAAEDLVRLGAELPAPVDGIVGHSLGGKIALEYVALVGGALDAAVIVDSRPAAGPVVARLDGPTDVLALLRALPPAFPSREAFVAAARAGGTSEATAAWLAQNLARSDGGYALALDLDAIAALLDDYGRRDLWRVVERPPGRVHLHIVVGERSPVWDRTERERLVRAAIAEPERVFAHAIDAGHNVHVDAPDALLDVVLGAVGG